tara:strand:- start:180 stop:353 length:174 start_codon:yes stop_codon:yes gene_type:complete
MAKAIKKSKGLTDRQKAIMKKHSVHHSAKHMSSMKKAMLSGKTFEQAHTIAQKQIGK